MKVAYPAVCTSYCSFRGGEWVDLNVFLSIKTQKVPSHKCIFNRGVAAMVLLGALGNIYTLLKKTKLMKCTFHFHFQKTLEILGQTKSEKTPKLRIFIGRKTWLGSKVSTVQTKSYLWKRSLCKKHVMINTIYLIKSHLESIKISGKGLMLP